MTKELSEQDKEDLLRAREQFSDSKGKAIHIAIHHVENLLRIIDTLTTEQNRTEQDQ